eukprot:3390801-Pleurochrysis_carterae.AAC.1
MKKQARNEETREARHDWGSQTRPLPHARTQPRPDPFKVSHFGRHAQSAYKDLHIPPHNRAIHPPAAATSLPQPLLVDTNS